MQEAQWFKLITDNLVSCVIAYMLLKFFIEIMKKKLLENNETEKQNLQKNIEIFNSLSNLNGKFDSSKKDINDCFSKTTVLLDKMSSNMDKQCTLLESLDRRVNVKGDKR